MASATFWAIPGRPRWITRVRTGIQCSSILFRYEQRRLCRQGGGLGCGLSSVISRLHVLQFSVQIWLLGEEWGDAASPGHWDVRNCGTRSIPGPGAKTAGRFADKGYENLRTAERPVPLRGLQ